VPALRPAAPADDGEERQGEGDPEEEKHGAHGCLALDARLRQIALQ
jgi:hypothetical protein